MESLKKVLHANSFTLFLAASFVLFVVPFSLFSEGVREEGALQMELMKAFKDNYLSCHGSEPQYPLLGTKLAYEHSGHYPGFERHAQNSYYANGRGCQQCHTNEGFIEYVSTGSVDAESYVANSSQPGCFTCHSPHERGDFSLRTTAPVTLVDGTTFDKGAGNLCANCHQARSRATDLVKPTPANRIAPYWGPHHGPEADLLLGTNRYEYPGKSYSSTPHGRIIADSCVTCHMTLPEGRYSLSPEVGGHSFYVVGDVHGSEKVNTAGCVSCHKDIGQASGTSYFNIMAKADYDNDGTVETVQGEVKGLLELLVNDRGTGYLQKLSVPAFKEEGSWNMTQSTLERSIKELGAI